MTDRIWCWAVLRTEEIDYLYHPLATLIFLIVNFNLAIAFPPSYRESLKAEVFGEKKNANTAQEGQDLLMSIRLRKRKLAIK